MKRKLACLLGIVISILIYGTIGSFSNIVIGLLDIAHVDFLNSDPIALLYILPMKIAASVLFHMFGAKITFKCIYRIQLIRDNADYRYYDRVGGIVFILSLMIPVIAKALTGSGSIGIVPATIYYYFFRKLGYESVDAEDKSNTNPCENEKSDEELIKCEADVAATENDGKAQSIDNELVNNYCRVCGAKLIGGAVYCQKCGCNTAEITCNQSDDVVASSQTLKGTLPKKIMYCRRCGYKFVEGSIFCSQCGNKIERDII